MKTWKLWAALAPVGLLLMAPGAALAAPLTPALMFVQATPLNKVIMLGLVLATLAALVVCVMKLGSGRPAGSPFLAALRAGGPLAGLLGGAYAALNTMIGIANVPITPPIKIIAPGVAEAFLLIGLGFLAGAVAVIGNWAVQTRSERGGLAA